MADERDIYLMKVTVTASWDDWSKYPFHDQRAFYRLHELGSILVSTLAYQCGCPYEQLRDTLLDLERLGYVTITDHKPEWRGIATLDDIKRAMRK